MECRVVAHQVDGHGSLAPAKAAELVLGSNESDARLDLMHSNILKRGTISNTLSTAVPLNGTLRRT